MHPGPRPRQIDVGLPPVDLRSHARRVDLRDEHVARGQAHLAAPLADVITDGRLSDIDTVLVDQAAPHPLGRVALLARGVEVSDQPLVDDLAVLTQLRRTPPARRALGRRNRRGERLSTARRCTPWRSANARIDNPSRSKSRLICSNCSTLEPTLCGLDPVLE